MPPPNEQKVIPLPDKSGSIKDRIEVLEDAFTQIQLQMIEITDQFQRLLITLNE